MAGEDAIIAVSKIFADLADEGGAAADSLATINSILRTSLNRTMLRFGRAMSDSVKSIQAFNVGIRNAAKRLSAPIAQRQAARMGAASQARESVHRTQAYVYDKQVAKQLRNTNIDDAFEELANKINNTLINSFERLANSVSKLSPVLDLIKDALLGLLATKAIFGSVGNKPRISGFTPSRNASSTSDADLAKDVAYSFYNRQKDIIGMSEAMSNRVQAVMSKYSAKIEPIMRKVNTAADRLKALSDLKTLNPHGVYDTAGSIIDAEMASIKSYIAEQGGLAKALRASRKQDINKAAQPNIFTDTLGDLAINLSNAAPMIKQSFGAFLKSIKISTALLGTTFVAAITYVTYKLYDFGKNAVPRLIDYLAKPLQAVYQFVTGPLNQAFSKITSFVSTFNPAYGEQASRALDDLSAVVGRMLLPVFNAMLGSLKVFTSFLSINSDRLKGTIKALADVIANMGSVIIGNFFVLLGQAQPIFEQLTGALQRAIPVINNALIKLFKEIQKHIPTFIKAIDAVGMMLEMYLKQKLQEFANEAALASKAAANQARAMELFGDEAITLSMAFNNLGYYIKDFMLQLEAVIIELMGWANWISGRPGAGGIVGGVEFAGGEDERDLNLGERAGRAVRKWVAGLFGAEDVPWANKPKEVPEPGAGVFDIPMQGADFGGAALQEGFAARGAAFQEIGQLGRNLAQAAFGQGAGTVEDQQLNVQQQILGAVNGMLQNQNQFNGAIPQQGVR